MAAVKAVRKPLFLTLGALEDMFPKRETVEADDGDLNFYLQSTNPGTKRLVRLWGYSE